MKSIAACAYGARKQSQYCAAPTNGEASTQTRYIEGDHDFLVGAIGRAAQRTAGRRIPPVIPAKAGIQRLGARPCARSPIATLAAMDARVRGHECAPRGRFVGTVEVRAGAGRSS